MKNFGKYVLGAALLAGGLGLGATSAQAAEFRIVVGGQSAYIPPCPGPGFVWVAGYYNNGYWVPGYWNYPSVGFVRDRGPVAIFDRDRDRRFAYVDRDDHRRDRDNYRGDRDDRGRDHDSHFRH
jgi:hypothetical protein